MSKSILIIDDNPRNNSGYINELEKHYNVDVAMRFVAAERLLKSRHYDIIVIDVMMPTQRLENHHDERTSGFHFYRDSVRPILKDRKPIIIFWSLFYDDCFDKFFGDQKPDNVFFLHKDSEDDSLLNYIELLLA